MQKERAVLVAGCMLQVVFSFFQMLQVFRCVYASLYEGLSVGLSVRLPWSIRGPSVPRFFLIAEIAKKQHRIIGKVETLFLDCNNLQKNSKTKLKNKILKQNFKTKF